MTQREILTNDDTIKLKNVCNISVPESHLLSVSVEREASKNLDTIFSSLFPSSGSCSSSEKKQIYFNSRAPQRPVPALARTHKLITSTQFLD